MADPQPITSDVVETTQGQGLEAYDIAVLVPCYNEEATVEEVVTDFQAALPHARV